MATKAIKAFGKAETRILSEVACSALEAVAAQYGLKVTAKGGKYAYGNCELKFEFAVIADDGVAKTREVESFRLSAQSYGLPLDAMGKEFHSRGETFRVVGLNSNARKMPIIGERISDGSRFRFPVAVVSAQVK